MSTLGTPQQSAVTTAPPMQPTPAASVTTAFKPEPKPGNQIQEFQLLGFKKAPYQDKQGQQKVSYKAFVLGDLDVESSYVENYGRGQATMNITEQVFNKLFTNGVNPRTNVVPLLFEIKMITGTNNSMKVTIVDVHISPYQKQLLDKGVQPDIIDLPVKN